MNVLLISSNQFKQPMPVIPIGICWIASTLEQAGHTVQVLDLMFAFKPEKAIMSAIDSFNPNVIGIGIRNIDDAHSIFLLEEIKKKTIDPCKKHFSGPIIIGGAAVGISGVEMLGYFDLEYALRGDGEISMLELVDRLQENKPVSGIKGLLIRRNGKIIEKNTPRFENNFEELPFSNPHKYIDLRAYLRRGANMQIQTKRGCALNCTYCVYNGLEGSHYRYRNPDDIADEIEMMHKEAGIDTFEFTDSTFNIPLKHAKAVLRAIAKKKLNIALKSVDLNPGEIDEEFADMLISSNFVEVGLSVESGSKKILENLSKNYKYEKVLAAEKILHDRNIPLIWVFMMGAPMETKATIQKTFDLIEQVAHWDEFVLITSGIRVYKGTPLSHSLERNGRQLSKDQYLRPVLCQPAKISVAEINKIVRRYILKTPNVLLLEDSISPVMLILSVITNVLKKKFLRIDESVLRTYVLYRRCQHFLGVDRVKSMLFETRQAWIPKVGETLGKVGLWPKKRKSV